MMNSLLTKFYNKYAIIYVQHSSKKNYIKYYNISVHRTDNLLVFNKRPWLAGNTSKCHLT